MKKLRKLAVALAFNAVMFSGFQTVWAELLSVSATVGVGIPIYIPIVRADDKTEFNLNPQPGFDVTLLPNQKVRFEWSNKAAKNFVIKDDKGRRVFTEKIGNKNSLDIVPGEKKLKAGQKYSWSVDDNLNTFEFIILDEQTEKELLDKLSEIEAQYSSEEERVIRKALYVQLLSDDSKYGLDLYWLSAQWLSEISPTDDELENDKYDLLERCEQHLNNEAR